MATLHHCSHRQPGVLAALAAARIAESGITLTLHPLNGWIPDAFHPQKPEDVGEGARLLLETFNEVQGTLGNDFIFGGIFDRHPTLKIV